VDNEGLEITFFLKEKILKGKITFLILTKKEITFLQIELYNFNFKQ